MRSAYTVISTGMIRSPMLRGARVELLAELHDVHAVLAERRTDGRRRVRLAGGALELDDRGDLLHDSFSFAARVEARGGVYAFSTWAKSSSTGVARPKIDSETLTFCLSGFTSSTVAEKFANGPSIDADGVARLEHDAGLRLGLALGHVGLDAGDLALGHRGRLGAAEEARDLRACS